MTPLPHAAGERQEKMATETRIDLQPFCAKENARWYRDKPFFKDGFIYATDARILVRLPAPGEPDTPDAPALNDVDLSMPEQATPWPQSEPIFYEDTCAACEGDGFVGRVECSDCQGEGEVDCPHCGNDMTCEKCGGRCYISKGAPCEKCDGKGRYEQPAYQRVSDGYVAYHYDQLVRSLGDVEFHQVKSDHGGYRFNLRFNGGVGAVMSKRLPDDVKVS